MLPKPPRRLGWRHRPRKAIRQEGKVGRGNRAFTSAMMAEWRAKMGPRLACAVTALTGNLVVGHIEGKAEAPARRWDRSNVAPITRTVNEQMERDAGFREYAQGKMREWVKEHGGRAPLGGAS